jgi:hypothetical protein
MSKNLLQPGIAAVLEQACIDQTEFKTLLGKAVALDKADRAASSTELVVRSITPTQVALARRCSDGAGQQAERTSRSLAPH